MADWHAYWKGDTSPEGIRRAKEAVYRLQNGKTDQDILSEMGTDTSLSLLLSGSKKPQAGKLNYLHSRIAEYEAASEAGALEGMDLQNPTTAKYYSAALRKIANDPTKRVDGWFGTSAGSIAAEEKLSSYIPNLEGDTVVYQTIQDMLSGKEGGAFASPEIAKKAMQILSAAHAAATVRAGNNKELVGKLNAEYTTAIGNTSFSIKPGLTVSAADRAKAKMFSGQYGAQELSTREIVDSALYDTYKWEVAPVAAEKMATLFSKENLKRMWDGKEVVLGESKFSATELDAYLLENNAPDRIRTAVSRLNHSDPATRMLAAEELRGSDEFTRLNNAMQGRAKLSAAKLIKVARSESARASGILSKSAKSDSAKAIFGAASEYFDVSVNTADAVKVKKFADASKNIAHADIDKESKLLRGYIMTAHELAEGNFDTNQVVKTYLSDDTKPSTQIQLNKLAGNLGINQNQAPETLRREILSKSVEDKGRAIFKSTMTENILDQLGNASSRSVDAKGEIIKDAVDPDAAGTPGTGDGKITTETIQLLYKSTTTLNHILQRLHL